jgi:hypothetical protein
MAEEVTAPVRSDALPNSEDEWFALLRFYRGRCDVSPATYAALKEGCGCVQRESEHPASWRPMWWWWPRIDTLDVHMRDDVADGVLHPCTCHDDQIPH